MSQQIAIASMQDLQAFLAKNANSQLDTLPPPTSTRVSAKKTGFALPTGVQLDELEIVPIGMSYINALYTKRYVPGQIESPTCWSVSLDANGMVPSDKSDKVQHTQCDGCPKNEWGSSPTGGGKACGNKIRVAFVTPDATTDSPVYTIDLAPTSTKPFIQTVRSLGERPMQTVIFKLSLDTKVDYPKVLTELDGDIDPGLVPHIPALMEKAQPLLVRGFDYDS